MSLKTTIKKTRELIRIYQAERFLEGRTQNLIEHIPKQVNKSRQYVDSLRVKDGIYGRYRYTEKGKIPLLYASVFAALFCHIVGDLQSISLDERAQWAEYIRSHQCSDGLFKDAAVSNAIAETEEWWGWRHLTLLCLMALYALGSTPVVSLNYLETYDSPQKIKQWIGRLDWGERASYSSNAVQNVCGSFQFFRDANPGLKTQSLINTILFEVSERCNSNNGLWGRNSNVYRALSEGVQAAYHFWLLYWYEGYNIPFPEQAFESLLTLQNKLGGFDLENIFSTACQDIDALYPIVVLSTQKKEFYEKSSHFIHRGLLWNSLNFNKNGGACFQKYAAFEYGHPLMSNPKGGSSIFATWFRTLLLAYCYPVFYSSLSSTAKANASDYLLKFHFLDCPGYQYSPNFNKYHREYS